MMKQPTFNWEAEDKYHELKNLTSEVNNVFKLYNMQQMENIAIIKIGQAEKAYNSQKHYPRQTRKIYINWRV